MKKTWFWVSRFLAAALALSLLCGMSLSGLAEEPFAPPADWQTIEHGGLVFSLPPDWALGAEFLGMRTGGVNSNGSGPRAGIAVIKLSGVTDMADMDEETYRLDVGDGLVYSDAEIEAFITEPIGDWKALRTALTAAEPKDKNVRYFLNEAFVTIGNDTVKLTVTCDTSMRAEFEETFLMIILSIRAPE